jgi:hypothetical protein
MGLQVVAWLAPLDKKTIFNWWGGRGGWSEILFCLGPASGWMELGVSSRIKSRRKKLFTEDFEQFTEDLRYFIY